MRGRRFDPDEMRSFVDAHLGGQDEPCPDCGEDLLFEKKYRPIVGASSPERFHVTCAGCGAHGQLQDD